MFKRPTSRRKTRPTEIILNLVPILDTMVTLVGFLLFTMSFLAIVSIESPFPMASRQTNVQKIKEKPLQLTLSLKEDQAEVWSPFQRVPVKKIANTPDGFPDLRAIHEHLIQIKKKFPEEKQIVLVPFPGMNYDTLISVMDAVRMLEGTDTPIFVRNQTSGLDEPQKLLFPEVVFGNLLGDA